MMNSRNLFLLAVAVSAAIRCTPASMPVHVTPIDVTDATSAVRPPVVLHLDAASFEKATDVIGDPTILGYPIDARDALKASIETALAGRLLDLSGPHVTVTLQDFDVDREIDQVGALSSRFTAEAVIALRADVVAAVGERPSSLSVSARKKATDVGIGDRMERQFATLVEAAVHEAMRAVIVELVEEIRKRLSVTAPPISE